MAIFGNFVVYLYVLYGKGVRSLHSLIARIRLVCYGAKVGRRLSVRGWINLHISPNAEVTIGNNIKIKSGFAENPVGGARMGIWVNRGGRLVVEDGACISNTTIVCDEEITIGKNTYIGGGTNIYDTDFHSLDPAVRIHGNDDRVQTSPVNIGRDCFIGGHCLILKGVTLGDKAIIGAGSVVTKDIPAEQIWAGNPARFIRKL